MTRTVRTPSRARWAALALGLAGMAGLSDAWADEGMWTFDNPPTALVQQRYGMAPTPAWLSLVQRSAVNYGGASASFVSGKGLLLTNHHVAMSCIDQLSSATRDLAGLGFVARKPAQELRCPGGVARVLLSSSDVTDPVLTAMAAGADDVQRNALRKSAIAQIETQCANAPGLRCEVVPLYSGSLFHLYRFREWDDVRLVFAPEYQAGFFGGDPDNFVYPRFALDFALLRVYDQGKPLATPEHLSLAGQALADGDLVFVAGHPGRTDRLQTLAQLKTTRDAQLPLQIDSALAQQAMLQAYGKRSPEAARQALDALFGTENWLKSIRGEYAALKDPALMSRKEADEARFRAAYRERGLKGDPWADVEAVTARQAARAKELWAVGYGYDTLFAQAGALVELAYERARPEDQRLVAYREAALPALQRRLKADRPFYKDLEIARLAQVLGEAQQLLGDTHPFVKTTLAGDAPEAAAQRWLGSSRLGEAAVRSALLDGGVKAIEASDDPLVRLAREVYPLKRELARFREEQIDTPLQRAAEQLGQARFTLYGRELPPDATGTLRLAYGKVAGYESKGSATPWKTTFGGLLARADSFDGKPPFDLAPRLAQARPRLDPRVPLNFVTTADITGGNSGSPVLNSRGEWVGLMFDTNLEALGGRFVYTDAQARSLAVHAQAIVHALERVYDAGPLAAELRGSPAGR
ncbi:MAG TPA: S46 family peptidase [Rhizobacter sp.]|nr:S46 family peptidase [Rhizobacter sp.]